MAGIVFFCLVGGYANLKSHCCCCRISYFWINASRVGSLLRAVWKYVDTLDMEDLTGPWRSLDFFVLSKIFICTNSSDDASVFLYTCGSSSKSLTLMPACVSNVNHLSQLLD